MSHQMQMRLQRRFTTAARVKEASANKQLVECVRVICGSRLLVDWRPVASIAGNFAFDYQGSIYRIQFMHIKRGEI